MNEKLKLVKKKFKENKKRHPKPYIVQKKAFISRIERSIIKFGLPRMNLKSRQIKIKL